MSEKIVPGPLQDCSASIQEAVCVNMKKIFDSCRDQDCIEDLRFYPVQCGQDVSNNAVSVKSAKAELLHVYTDVEAINFNRGFYTVDLRYFYRVVLQVCCGCGRPTEVEGLCVFDKRVVLFGSEGGAKVFTSGTCMTVSYTHLDVYKRQAVSAACGCSPAILRRCRRAWRPSAPRI